MLFFCFLGASLHLCKFLTIFENQQIWPHLSTRKAIWSGAVRIYVNIHEYSKILLHSTQQYFNLGYVENKESKLHLGRSRRAILPCLLRTTARAALASDVSSGLDPPFSRERFFDAGSAFLEGTNCGVHPLLRFFFGALRVDQDRSSRAWYLCEN